MLRLVAALVLWLAPTVACWYYGFRLAGHRKARGWPMGSLAWLTKAEYTSEGQPLLVRLKLSLILTAICYGIVFLVLHP